MAQRYSDGAAWPCAGLPVSAPARWWLDQASFGLKVSCPGRPGRSSTMPAPRGRNPFDTAGVSRGPDGIARYENRPDSLVQMLRATVERVGDGLAVSEIGGERVTYGELWDRAARVAGGLRGEGVERGDRVAIRLPNGLDWVLAFWGAQLAGAVVVPVNTRFKDSEAQYLVDDSEASYVFGALPDGEPVVVDDLGPDDL